MYLNVKNPLHTTLISIFKYYLPNTVLSSFPKKTDDKMYIINIYKNITIKSKISERTNLLTTLFIIGLKN